MTADVHGNKVLVYHTVIASCQLILMLSGDRLMSPFVYDDDIHRKKS